MLRATRVLREPVKRTTGIAGLDVDPNARETLIKLYEKTLKDIQIIPSHVFYRQTVENFTKYRMEVVKSNEDPEKIEDIINCGQLEELIEQAKDELRLIPEYAEWREWDDEAPKPTDDRFDDIYDQIDSIDPASLRDLGISRKRDATE